MAMGPRFKSPLPLAAAGHEVMASGPIDWQKGDVSVRIDIVVRQKPNGSAHASSPPVFMRPQPEWALCAVTVPQGGSVTQATLVAGPARGIGAATFTEADGSTRLVSWKQDIVLV